MKLFIALLASLLFSTSLMAQTKVLEASNATTGKSRTFKVGTTFKIRWDKDSLEYSKVRIEQIKDNSVVFSVLDEESTTLLELTPENIVSIKKATCLHSVGYAVGSVLILGGFYTVMEAGGIEDRYGANESAVRIGGVACVGAGIIPFLIKPAEYGNKTGYKISIK